MLQLFQTHAFLNKQPKRTAGSWPTEGRNFENRKNISKILTVLSFNYYMPVGYEAGCRSIHQRLFDFLDNTACVCQRLSRPVENPLGNCNLYSFEHHPAHRYNLQMHMYMCDRRQAFFPVVRIGSPHPLTRKRVWGEEQHSLVGEGNVWISFLKIRDIYYFL
jgi:hypothetical protein